MIELNGFFLKSMMIRLGFAQSWVSTIMKCVSSVSYSVMLNGKVGGRFNPSRGLRQKDHLSPYLFLICNKGLSSLLRFAMRDGHLREAKANRNDSTISHLLFTDDSILFAEASA